MKIAAQPAGFRSFSDFSFQSIFGSAKAPEPDFRLLSQKAKTGTTEATKQHRTLDREGSKYSFRQHVAVKVLFFCFYCSINDFKYFQQLTQGSSALHVSVSLSVYLFLNVQMSQIQFNINNLHEWNLDWNKNTFMYILDVLIPPVWKQEDILQPQLSTLTAELE